MATEYRVLNAHIDRPDNRWKTPEDADYRAPNVCLMIATATGVGRPIHLTRANALLLAEQLIGAVRNLGAEDA